MNDHIDDLARAALRDGAQIIARDGWHQGAYYEGHSWTQTEGSSEAARTAPVCAIGSIRRALWGSADLRLGAEEFAVAMRAESLLERHLGNTNGVPDWNDAPERTAEDVILAMKKAADGE